MVDSPATDEELVQRCAAGDRAALGAIYDRYGVLVFSLVVRILGEGMAAEEVTQDAFLAVWRRSGDYSPQRGRVLPWLLTIARNRAVDELRRRRVTSTHVELPDELALQSGLEDVALSRIQIRRALAELPAAQRQALEL
ncbi:MAG: sigma-70 family RNA polymerase sigma factor, partial [Anaerolineae bacterium]|nr:sigma-70 family RNA polymerase sigma factor [Anaerolineae bacterium]